MNAELPPSQPPPPEQPKPESSNPEDTNPEDTPVGRRLLLVVLLAPLFMALVAISVINVALSAIGSSLGSDSQGLQWVLSGYALAFGVLLVPAGRAGDATGRRRMLLIGVGVFTAGSLLSGAAPNVEVLNLSRILQGIGSGLLNPQTVGLIQLHFRGQARARAFAAFGTTVALATAVGPVIGGLLIQLLGEDVGWRWMFFMNVPIGVVTIILGLRWIPDDRVRRSPGRLDLDPVGTGLLTVAILAVMLPFLERGSNVLVWLCLPAGLALLYGWVRWENRYKARGRPPMVDLDIFRGAAFRNGILIITSYFLGATSIWIVVPLYVMMHLGHSAFAASLLGLPSSVAAGIASQWGGRHVLRLGRRLVIAGMAIAAVGLIAVALLAGPVESRVLPFWSLAVPLVLLGVSQGMTISPNQTLTLNAVEPRFGGVAGGILQLGQRIGTAIGTALIPGILFSLTEGGTSWLVAFRTALLVIAVLSLVAMAVSVQDRKRERAEGPAGA